MNVEQIYTGCLAQGAYFIESEGEIAIIDPLRETQPYVDRANKINGKIKYIFETHFHADFVSGHIDLSKKTWAPIIYGPTAQPKFEAIIAEDNQIFELGKVKIKVLHTPGHTMESTTYLLLDEEGKEHAIFSGDTLFLGDVGRPDLAQKAANMTQEDLAGLLFDSLRIKIMPLPDEVTVYPGHGAGSACGKNMMKETVDTLGNQKKMNYALRSDMTKEEFIKEVTDGLLPPPQYFPENVKMNKEGYQSIDKVIEKGVQALSVEAFEIAANATGALILDTRDPQVFNKGFIPNSINIGLNGTFAPWVGALIPSLDQNILLITEKGKEKEAVTRLARVGYDHTIGFLKGGFDAWKNSGKEIDKITSISAEELSSKIKSDSDITILDVRKEGEYNAEHIKNAINIPLDFINERMAEIPGNKTLYIHCAGGYRSMIYSSILKSRGYDNLIEIAGGYNAIKNTDTPTTDFTCQSNVK